MRTIRSEALGRPWSIASGYPCIKSRSIFAVALAATFLGLTAGEDILGYCAVTAPGSC